MALEELAKHLRYLLSNPVKDSEIDDFLGLLDEEIINISASEDSDQKRRDFEEELQAIYDEEVVFDQLQSVEIFLEVLIHARPILPATTVIANWFDLLLRPALREPRLKSSAVEHAKRLAIEALEDDGHDPEMINNFRRRLVDLFLLDAFDESSSKDILEWAQLDESQKAKNIWWKSNLEEILTRYGLVRPEGLMDVMQECFVMPSARLQIVTLLDSLSAESTFLDIASVVFTHPFMESIYRSLEVDNSSTVCAVELAVLIKILPAAAVKEYQALKLALPRLHGILGRVFCWRRRVEHYPEATSVPYSDLLGYEDKDLVSELEQAELDDDAEYSRPVLQLRDDLEWKRLERTFDLSTSSLPVPTEFFRVLYFLFPCNTVKFLRNASEYMEEKHVESPWTVDWKDAFDDLQIRTVGGTLLRRHILHPSILWYDSNSELDELDRWSGYDVSRIMGECMMLDIQAAGSSRDRIDVLKTSSPSPVHRPIHKLTRSGDVTSTQTPTIRNIQLDDPVPRQRKISLHDLIATSVALKSGADINVSDKTPAWPSILFTPPPSTLPSAAPSRSSSIDPSMVADSPTEEVRIPTQIGETIAGLQREVLLLRTELNFELWLKRENVRHIGRLHHEEVLTKSAGSEQQRLKERLREYRSKLLELKEQKDQASSVKKRTTEWNEELSSKLDELRRQKSAWLEEKNALRNKNADLEAHFAAQGKLLDEAQGRVFQLESQIKDDAHKITRLRDYEKRIDQLTNMLRLWERDIIHQNEQAKEITRLVNEHQKMKMRFEECEKLLLDAELAAQKDRRRIQTLEARLRAAETRAQTPRQNVTQQLFAEQANERDALAKSNKVLREQNQLMQEELLELRAKMEVDVSGTTGLIFPSTRASAS